LDAIHPESLGDKLHIPLLSKAFRSIPKNQLLNRSQQTGVNANMVRPIQEISDPQHN
jgi:hypothetical protein